MKKLLFTILFCLLATRGWCSFPTTPVLDTFTRANSNTTLGTNWTISTSAYWGNDVLGISSNAAYDTTGTNSGIAFWNVSTFSGTNIEAYVTLSNIGAGSNDSGICFATSTSSYLGYVIIYSPSNKHIDLYRLTSSTSALVGVSSAWSTSANGDSIGVSLNTSTGVFTFYYESVSGGGWVNEGTLTDTNYVPTVIGIEIGDTTARETNFGGSTQALATIYKGTSYKATYY